MKTSVESYRSREERISIASTILGQIGNRALTMIGASQLTALDGGVQFKIGRNTNRVNFVIIELNASDTYDVTYGRVYGTDWTVISEEKDLYFDMLTDSIERNTGLRTSL